MGYDNGRTVAQHLVEGCLKQTLALGVEGRGCFIKDEQVGITEEGTGDADALSLASAKEISSLAKGCVIAFGESSNKVMGLGCSCGLFYIMARCSRAAKSDIGSHSIVEK